MEFAFREGQEVQVANPDHRDYGRVGRVYGVEVGGFRVRYHESAPYRGPHNPGQHATAVVIADDLTAVEGLAIWWLSGQECAEVREMFVGMTAGQTDHLWIGPAEGMPRYILEEVVSLLGRPAGGRLWVAPEFDGEPLIVIPDFDSLPLAPWTGTRGGIVIRRQDAPLVAFWPGFVTTLGLEILR